MHRLLGLFGLVVSVLAAQTPPPTTEQWRALSFLEGTWDAKTTKAEPGVTSAGLYTFRKELGGHILARHTTNTGCKGPVDYNCDHSDELYVYEDAAGGPLKAIYFDNEGHVIHYTVSTPGPKTAVFASEPNSAGPRFRLVYELKGSIMEGKFQILMPGRTEWNSYLEWSGGRKSK